jgi:hypothetical protein
MTEYKFELLNATNRHVVVITGKAEVTIKGDGFKVELLEDTAFRPEPEAQYYAGVYLDGLGSPTIGSVERTRETALRVGHKIHPKATNIVATPMTAAQYRKYEKGICNLEELGMQLHELERKGLWGEPRSYFATVYRDKYGILMVHAAGNDEDSERAGLYNKCQKLVFTTLTKEQYEEFLRGTRQLEVLGKKLDDVELSFLE